MERLAPSYQKPQRTRQTRRVSRRQGTTPRPQRRPVPTRLPLRSAPGTVPLTPPDRLLTLHELCQWLGLKKTRVYFLIRQGALPVYKIGGVYRFDPRQVWQWVQGWQVSPSWPLPNRSAK